MKEWSKEDLARIHDVAHGNFALESAPGIRKILEQNGIREGLRKRLIDARAHESSLRRNAEKGGGRDFLGG